MALPPNETRIEKAGPIPQWQELVRLNRPLPRTVATCIHKEISNHAATKYGKPAIESWDGNLTYSQLDSISTRLAFELGRNGVGAESIVPLCFEKSKWMIVSMLAVLKAGGAFVAFDPDQKESRTRSILKQTEARIIVTSTAQKKKFARLESVGTFEVSDETSCAWSTANIQPTVVPENAAYVIFTSGSTGDPKGIIVEHRSFCSAVAMHAPAQFMDQATRALQFAAYTHDTSLAEVLTTLCVGGTVCVPSMEQRANSLTEFIQEKAVNWAVLTPSFITSISPEDVPTLKVIVLAGERLSQSSISTWCETVSLLSGYGVSECSVCSTISRPLTPGTSAKNIGLPAGGVCWIVNPDNVDELMGVGEIGEIIIEGPTVSRGYIKNADANSRSFIEPPRWLLPLLSTSDLANKLYRTGDLGRQNADGTLDFVSRIDSQIKLAGRRIELGEIEHLVAAHQAVKLCMVAFPQAGAYKNMLVCILQLHDLSSRNARVERVSPSALEEVEVHHHRIEEIAQSVRKNAPLYLVPSVWFVLAQFPQLPSAKIDRRSVSEWLERHSGRQSSKSLFPLIPSEDSLAIQIALEAKALGIGADKASVAQHHDAPLATLGIDSIKAISLMRRLQKLFGVKIHVEHFLHHEATPTAIANRISSANSRKVSNHQTSNKNLTEALTQLREDLRVQLAKAPARLQVQPGERMTVLLTGATGYLGIEILRQFLISKSWSRVIVLVRAVSSEEARKRVVDIVMDCGWWKEEYETRIEAWAGDLSQPKLGLSSTHWERISGSDSASDYVNAIVHNAATVHWTKSAAALWSVNVDSTMALLSMSLQSPFVTNFVYLSGGANLSGSIEEQLLEASDGYTQTKLMGQALVQDLAAESTSVPLSLAVIKPSFIVASVGHGTANPRDYLWRFVASVIDLGIYDESTENAWVAFSTNEIVASMVVKQTANELPQKECLHTIESGAQEKSIWEVLQKLGVELHPVDHGTWVTRMQYMLEVRRESHVLWPLLDVLEKQNFGIGRAASVPGIFKETENSLQILEYNVRELFKHDLISKSGIGDEGGVHQ